ncbi:MAG TPA: hypothetical protein VJS67_12455 [Pseudonocardiaceae bacterium]|nr:hypothetical protein [Pseudonocardiaceae bacterium]
MADVSPTRAQHDVLTLTDCTAATSLKQHANASAYDFPMFSQPTTSDVCLARLAGGECLHQHELVRVVNTAGPLEEQVAFFVPGGLGEFVGELQPLVASVGADRPLDNDEDHGCALALRAPAGTAPLAVDRD